MVGCHAANLLDSEFDDALLHGWHFGFEGGHREFDCGCPNGGGSRERALGEGIESCCIFAQLIGRSSQRLGNPTAEGFLQKRQHLMTHANSSEFWVEILRVVPNFD
jgi:hypothetical protein